MYQAELYVSKIYTPSYNIIPLVIEGDYVKFRKCYTLLLLDMQGRKY